MMTRDFYPHNQHQQQQQGAADVTLTSPTSRQGETCEADVIAQANNGHADTTDDSQQEGQEVKAVDSDVIQLDCGMEGSDELDDVRGGKGRTGSQAGTGKGEGGLDAQHTTTQHTVSDGTPPPAADKTDPCDPRDPCDVNGKASSEEEVEEGKKEGGGCCGRRKDVVASVGAFGLFRYAGPVEVVMMAVGTLAAMVTGCVQPLSMLMTGDVVNTFITNTLPTNTTNGSSSDWGSIQEEIQPLVHVYLGLGAGALVSAYTAVSLWTWAGQRQITRIRKLYFRSAMRQDMAWFDTHPVAQLNSRFSDDMHKIHEGLADKVPVFLQWCSTCLAAYVIAFLKGWKLALAVLTFSPLFVAVAAGVSWTMRGMAVKEMRAYAMAGAVAEQALRAIRTVQAFDGQRREHSKYEDNLASGRRLGIRKGLVVGAGSGLFLLIIYSSFAVSYYYGIVLIQTDGLEPGSVFVVFFAVLFGSLSLGHAFPNLETFSNARAAAVHIFDVIDLHPYIDVSSPAGLTLTSLTGVIEFRDVHFQYPARPDVPVLTGLSLRVAPGQTVALVGSSGCGKSTTLQLLQRFYDPMSGQVCLDGHDLRELNVRWLRDQLGVVSQEPVLFAATIADNIRYGQPDVTQDLVRAAAAEANAHDFICQLPQGYDTLVGERGAQLSGGQKQRIAIARALVKNPRILLLDEATSALDSESEAVVQSALDKARQGRTTIVIAHRLSTIRHADVIVTLSGGRKVEEGSHQALTSRQGMYATLLRAQSTAEQEDVNSNTLSDATVVEGEGNDVKRTVTNGAETSGAGSVRAEKTAGSAGRDGDPGEEGEAQHTTKGDKASVGVRRLLAVNRPEWPFLVAGTALSALCGLSQPCFAFIFSEFISVFAITDEEEQTRQTVILSSFMAALGVSMAVFKLASEYCFSKAGAALTARLRSLTFRSMLNQDMSFFDHPDNQVGSLTTRLAYDAALVQGATGSKLGAAMEALFTVTASLVIAFTFGWKLSLLVLAFMPVVMAAGRVQGRVISGSATSGKSQLQEAGKICSEAVDNIRTVTSLNRGDIFIHKMEALLDNNSLSRVRMAQVFGVTYGISVSVQYFALSACFTFGAKLVALGEMQFHNIFRVFGAIVMGGSAVGRNSSFGVDYSKGRVAASRLFAILDRVPAIDSQQTGGKTLPGYRGEVGVEGAVFQYPGRDQVRVLAGLTVRATPGQTVAVVGPSGCGKSTVLQLLLRFYDPSEGQVVVGGADVRTLDLQWWRRQVGVVSQEPLLFDDTIAANIAYGDTSRAVPMAEVISAARAANIHDFVTSLPQGYDTQVGDKGTQLSGGQKQRLAIARALVRLPKVLLLDEATSALDTESERVVQEALDRARQGRTCFVIAHRLTTIQTADVIAVIQDGRVRETGTHSQLLASRGAYYGLLQAQHAFRKA